MGFFNGILRGLGFESENNNKETKEIKKENINKDFNTAYNNAGLKVDLNTIEVEQKEIQPESQQDIQKIVDLLKKGEAVTVNLSKLDDENYVRSLDFMSGAIYVLNGKIKKVKEKTFFFCPNVK